MGVIKKFKMTGCEKILQILKDIKFSIEIEKHIKTEQNRYYNQQTDISFYITQYLYEGSWYTNN